jgi:hypothetical protein
MENAEAVHFGQLERSEYEKKSLYPYRAFTSYPKEHINGRSSSCRGKPAAS